MTPEEVIARWIERHPHISTPEWGAQNLILDLGYEGFIIVDEYETNESEDS
jgi:hypothetical protein